MSDAEFRRSLANCSSWRTDDYFWTWHKSFPHMTLADMHAKIEADRAAAEAAEWEAEQAYTDRFERTEAELLAEQADLEEAAHPELVAEIAAARVIIAEAEETERVALAALEAAEKAFAEAAPETSSEVEVYFLLQDTLRLAREATAEARHPGLAAAAQAADVDEARGPIFITAIPPRGRPTDPEELFASSTSSPATLLQAEAAEAAAAEWYDHKEWERSDPG